MQASNIPAKIQLPFANDGDKNTIPVPSQIPVTDGAASFTTGFPPLTFTPLDAGGVAPFGKDFNGLLFQVTAVQQWQSAGGIFQFDSAFSSAIGGYPKGSILLGSDFLTSFLSIIDNNTNDPNAATPVGWVALSGGRLLGVQTFIASGTYTPTFGTKRIIVELQGSGGGGGGALAASGNFGSGGGGGAGGYVKHRISSGILATYPVVIGIPGAGVAGGTGTAGGTSTFGSILTATGGGGGGAGGATGQNVQAGGAGGVGTGGNILNSNGSPGGNAVNFTNANSLSGCGGASVYGGGAYPTGGGNAIVGNSAVSLGAGGSGASTITTNLTSLSGGFGKQGIVIIHEYS